jgi:hypothetical protein
MPPAHQDQFALVASIADDWSGVVGEDARHRRQVAHVAVDHAFAEPTFQKLPLVWNGETPQSVLELLHRGTVRTPMLIEAQTPEIQQAIEEAILRTTGR